MRSEWNQWLVPAPMRIIERPPESSAFCANSRPKRSAWAAGTPVCSSCHAGVYGAGSSYPVGQSPGRPSRATPNCAIMRSNTVVTMTSSSSSSTTVRTGTPRVTVSASPRGVSKRGRTISAVSPPLPCRLSTGSISPRSRFQRPLPCSPNRSPSVPFGTTTRSVTASSITVLLAAFSPGSTSSRTASAVRNLSGTTVPSARVRRVTRNGRSV